MVQRTTGRILTDRDDTGREHRHMDHRRRAPFVSGDGMVSLRASSTNTTGADYVSK